MKTSLLKIFLLVSTISGFSTVSHSQIIVTVRPTAPVVVRPLAPSPRHVWIDGGWIVREGRYEYANGYWIMPKYAGSVWIPGHWKNARRGWVWKAGHWRR